MTSEVSICNLALQWLGKGRITSLTDGTNEANACKDNFDAARDFVLADADWTFATKRFELPPSTTPPPFGFANRFLVPEEVLRVVAVNEMFDNFSKVSFSGGNTWQLEDGYILTDDGVVNMRGVVFVSDPNKFSPGFVQCFAARLAADMAAPLTNSNTREQAMEAKYAIKLEAAKHQDGRQGTSKRIISRWLERARWSSGGGFFGPTV
jgi:hypothetical protein